MNATEAAILLTPSGPLFGSKLALQERMNLNLDFQHILGIRQTCQEACEVAEEDEMKDEHF